MVLNTEWTQLECVELEGDGAGPGFGIVGGRSSGVIVKSLVPGGPASRDNRLQIGDHILQINGVNMRGMGSDQVGQILRQSGPSIKLIVARPVDPTSDLQVIENNLTIVPTRSLNDPTELEKQIVSSASEFQHHSQSIPTDTSPIAEFLPDLNANFAQLNIQPSPSFELPGKDIPPITTTTTTTVSSVTNVPLPFQATTSNTTTAIEPEREAPSTEPSEMETFDVELIKDQQGLGITIAGYVCNEKSEEISGIFIKCIAPSSVAARCGKIQENDQIIEVDGRSLHGYTNSEAVDLLRKTQKVVKLKLARLKGGQSLVDDAGESTSVVTTPVGAPSHSHSAFSHSTPRYMNGSTVIEVNNGNIYESVNPIGGISTPAEAVAKWEPIIGPQHDIIVATVTKLCHDGGLGISLEGNIDIGNGIEARPHHYINSIIPNGPVGRNGLLKKGDELLEVNGIRLHGLRYSDVLPLLKDLPIEVQLVCARPPNALNAINNNNNNQENYLDSNNSQLLTQPFIDRLVKAKSDGSLAITPLTSISTSQLTSELSRLRSRSLEPLSGLAMWSSEPVLIKLIKGDRGLGFSILDYQDPMNPSETVIVIRSLVPGGVAQQDGRLLPGDRLLFVNDRNLENASLEEAVQALKGAPRGVVVVGVAKPLPLPETCTLQLTAAATAMAAAASSQ
ncbi:PREDICTED: LOW QUALITY PROTEIN: patj homolog, partial [Rhagoletis zephyria]|uniref:LOW QUALITY PROTEIN: patj homolog n=1 Tax=Rhagoletis zephyria TaxID=28612 RepID=UPI000811351C